MNNAADVIVVGGGIVGAATAYFLARQKVKVLLIEAETPAWGASGRNPGYQWLHTRRAGLQMEFGLAGRRLADTLVEELDGFEFRPSGGMIYYFDERQEPLFESLVAERRAAGLPMELIDGKQARERCPLLSDRVAGATWNPLDAHQNTKKLVDALVLGAERHGARLLSGVRVEAVLMNGERCVGIRTATDTFNAGTVILAAGSWTPKLLAPHGIDIPITAMRLQVVETEPTPVRFEPLLYGPTALKQYAFIRDLPGYSDTGTTHPLESTFNGVEFLELAVQREDGRILLGCPMDFPGLDDRPTVSGLALTLAVLSEAMPAIKSLAVERIWAGLLPQTPDALPIIGRVPGIDGLMMNAGHVFGNLAGPLSGKILAQSMTGEKPDFDLDLFRLDRPGLRANNDQHRRW
jgi:glycine/D-amino acid oxidase-like deaminating enzyme